MKINESQMQAIQAVDGQLAIIACPGSGKTTTLLNRIYYMTTELHIKPSSILMVTFSKAAADEMKERYINSFGKATSVYFGTIHAFCNALVLKYSSNKMLKGVISEQDIYTFLKGKSRNIQGIGNINEFIKDLKNDISVYKSSRCHISSFTPKSTKSKEKFIELYESYEEHKKNRGFIDYDDMLLIAYDILCNNQEVLQWVRNKYKYVLVDEYQDVNELQRDIIYKIVGENGNLTVVGDDDQAIYGFRGASTSIMLNFQNDYPNSRIIYLSTNYRSHSEIILAAGQLIKNNKARFDKEFISYRGEGGEVQLLVATTREKEMELLVSDISQKISEGVPPEEIAVIYRINKQDTLVAKALFNANIEFKTNEKIESIYDHWIFQDILAFYRMAQGTGNQDDFEQTLNRPNRYLHNEIYKRKGPDKEYMIQTAYDLGEEEWKIENTVKQIESYFTTLSAIREADKPGDAIKRLIYGGEYRKYLTECAEFRNEDVSDLNMILDGLEKSASMCGSWDEWQNLIIKEKRELEVLAKGRTGVTLTTIHKAKGLEWKIVYIIDCVDGKCPYIKAKNEDELEEERRLFYVAMTRAKDKLILMRSKIDGTKILKESMYIKECGISAPLTQSTAINLSAKSRVASYKGDLKKYYMSGQTKKEQKEIPEIAVNDKVHVVPYGDGNIKSITFDEKGYPKKFVVHFVIDGDKTYVYPDAFSRGMTKK